MGRKHKVGLVTGVMGLALGAALAAGPASVAPITCPDGQTVTKTADGWTCVNGGGNPTGRGCPLDFARTVNRADW